MELGKRKYSKGKRRVARGRRKAMHEEYFLSIGLWEDGRVKKERTAKASEKNEERRAEKRKREEEKEENKTARVRRKRGGLVFVEAFDFLSRRRFGELWWSVLVGHPWRSLRTGLIVSLIRLRMCVWCLM